MKFISNRKDVVENAVSLNRKDIVEKTASLVAKDMSLGPVDKKWLDNKINLLLIYEVINGNPNGDPDSGNMPRQNVDTGKGYVTNVCINRKIRNAIELLFAGIPGMDIFVTKGVALDAGQKEAMAAIPRPDKKGGNSAESIADYARRLKRWMCDKYFDVRAFGQVCQLLTKGVEKGGAGVDGAITGCVQFNVGKSVDPVNIERVTITRCALANQEEVDKHKSNTMGVKYIIPYGLYTQHCSISPYLCKQTGFTEDDLDKLLEAIKVMFDLDKSSARGEMRLRKLIMFRHDSRWGKSEQKCYDSVVIHKKVGVDVPDSYEDYEIELLDTVPEGVTRTVLVDD